MADLTAKPGETYEQYETRLGAMNEGTGTGFGTPDPYTPPPTTTTAPTTTPAPLTTTAPSGATPQAVNTGTNAITEYLKQVSTTLPSGVPTRNQVPSNTAQTTNLNDLTTYLRNLFSGATPPAMPAPPMAPATTLQEYQAQSGFTTANDDLTAAKNDLTTFEQEILKSRDRIKGQAIATALINGQLTKLDADTAEAYRQKQNAVSAAGDRLNMANQTMGQLMTLTQQNYQNQAQAYQQTYQNMRQSYEFETNKAFQFLQMAQAKQDKDEARAQAMLTGFINVAQKNPDAYTKATAVDKAQWNAWELQAGFPTGYIEAVLKSGKTSGLEPWQAIKGDDGSVTVLYKKPDGTITTARVISGTPGSSLTASNAPEGFADAFNFMSSRLSKDEAARATKYFNGLLAVGDYDTAREYLKSTSIANLPATEQGKAFGRFVALDALADIKQELSAFITKGGDTNIFSGSLERIAQKVGTTSNPELAGIGNKILMAMIAYRNAVSGAAFTESEQRQYASIFPSTGNVPALNDAKIDSLIQTFNLNNKSVFSQILGPTNYDKLFPQTASSAPSTGGGGLSDGLSDDVLRREFLTLQSGDSGGTSNFFAPITNFFSSLTSQLFK